ncbi:Flp family type IVb pilin [Myxococcota bacterium]|nr:Flp family type IVb pilin [Myxococcota bacterium]
MARPSPASTLKRLAHDESGATSIEYALIAILVSVGIILALQAFANAENELFEYIRTKVVEAIS